MSSKRRVINLVSLLFLLCSIAILNRHFHCSSMSLTLSEQYLILRIHIKNYLFKGNLLVVDQRISRLFHMVC